MTSGDPIQASADWYLRQAKGDHDLAIEQVKQDSKKALAREAGAPAAHRGKAESPGRSPLVPDARDHPSQREHYKHVVTQLLEKKLPRYRRGMT